MTVSWLRGISTLMFFRLWVLAPRIFMLCFIMDHSSFGLTNKQFTSFNNKRASLFYNDISMKKTILVLSCEHAVNTIPGRFQSLFDAEGLAMLQSFRGYDIGAQQVAHYLKNAFHCDYFESMVSRLLIDCNRSLTHPNCFSTFTNHLSQDEKEVLINHFYLPYRNAVEQTIHRHIMLNEQVLHLSVHSFMPSTDKTKEVSIGVLYDSRRHAEKEVARILLSILSHKLPMHRMRFNYPCSGRSNRFTAQLRKKHTESEYLGFDLEINQILLSDIVSLNKINHGLSHGLRALLELL